MSNELVEIYFDRVIKETRDSWKIDFGDSECWIPKSIATLNDTSHTVSMPEWLAIQKELV